MIRFFWSTLSILAVSFFAAVLTETPAKAESKSANCYRLQSVDSPEAAPQAVRSEIWCYQHLNYPAGALFIYRADDSEARPETSLIVTADGVITHGSRSAGELSLHSVQARQFNPFSVPLTEPNPELRANPDEVQASPESIQKVLELLTRKAGAGLRWMSLAPGKLEAQVPPDRLPWRGYWWSYFGKPLFAGKLSPLAKYDRFVESKTGVNPGAQQWEEENHNFSGMWWEGHCNGWAASAILRKEPNVELQDPLSKVYFSISDLKGLLSERDYCASTTFFGRRYNGLPNDDINDVYAPVFHKALIYFIGQLGKPIAIDMLRNEKVDNNIVSGYKMEIEPNGPHTYIVHAKLRIHKYDLVKDYPAGPAPSFAKYYTYSLTEDEKGNIVKGEWLSENPDFLWMPLASPKCKYQNPKIEEKWIREIFNLPPAR